MKIALKVVLCLVLLGSCRSILRTQSSTDSTASRSQEQSEKFTREIVREYLPGKVDTVYQHSVSTVEIPKYVTVPGPVMVRETIRETGEKQQVQTEQKQVATQDKQVEKQPMPWWAWMLIGAGVIFSLVLIGFFAYVGFKIVTKL